MTSSTHYCVVLGVADSSSNSSNYCSLETSCRNDEFVIVVVIIIVIIIIIRTWSLRCSWCSQHGHVRRNQKSVSHQPVAICYTVSVFCSFSNTIFINFAIRVYITTYIQLLCLCLLVYSLLSINLRTAFVDFLTLKFDRLTSKAIVEISTLTK